MKHSDADIPMPDDGTETENATATQTPPSPKQRKKSEEIPEGYTKTVTRIRPTKANGSTTSPVEKAQPAEGQEPFGDSPVERDAASARVNWEVERTGPGTGTGWKGRTYMGRDVSYARVGSFPDTDDIYDRVVSVAGGGTYKFVGEGRDGKTVVSYKTFPGEPLPLPGDADPSSQTLFEEFETINQGGQGFSRVQDSGVFVDQDGNFAAAETEEENLGWIWAPSRNVWLWKGKGRPPGRPPSGMGGSQASFDVDHSGRGSSEFDELKAMVKGLMEQRSNPMEGFLAIMQAQAEERRTQLAEDRLRWEQEKEEREARRKEESALARDSAKIQAEAQREVAKMQAEAMKGNASSAVEAAKEMAKMQQAQTTQLVTILTQKQEQGGFDAMFDRVAKFNDLVQGNKPESNPATEISQTIREIFPTVAESVRDSIYAYRGLPIPAGGNLGQVPQLTDGGEPSQNSQATQTQQQPQQAQGGQGGLGEAGQFLQLVGYLANSCRKGMPPKASVLAHGCLAFNLDERYGEVRSKLIQANPELVAMMVEQTVKQAGSPPQFVEFSNMVKATILAPQGRGWFVELQKSLSGDVAREQAQAQQNQQQKAAQQAPPAPAS